jgi:hypothetical protein
MLFKDFWTQIYTDPSASLAPVCHARRERAW